MSGIQALEQIYTCQEPYRVFRLQGFRCREPWKGFVLKSLQPASLPRDQDLQLLAKPVQPQCCLHQLLVPGTVSRPPEECQHLLGMADLLAQSVDGVLLGHLEGHVLSISLQVQEVCQGGKGPAAALTALSLLTAF